MTDKKSIISLKDRLADWLDWDGASYEVGACLGFWPEFGTDPGQDNWNGVKGVMWSRNPLGEAIANFLEALVEEGMLERREEPDTGFRWNPNYKQLDL